MTTDIAALRARIEAALSSPWSRPNPDILLADCLAICDEVERVRANLAEAVAMLNRIDDWEFKHDERNCQLYDGKTSLMTAICTCGQWQLTSDFESLVAKVAP